MHYPFQSTIDNTVNAFDGNTGFRDIRCQHNFTLMWFSRTYRQVLLLFAQVAEQWGDDEEAAETAEIKRQAFLFARLAFSFC